MGAANHARKAEEAVSRLWREFEAACLGCGITTIGRFSADTATNNSGDNKGAEDGGTFGDDGGGGGGGGGVALGGRARAAPDGRPGGSADGGRGRRRRVGGGILSTSKAKGSAVSGRDLTEGGGDGGREVPRGEEHGRKPWVD